MFLSIRALLQLSQIKHFSSYLAVRRTLLSQERIAKIIIFYAHHELIMIYPWMSLNFEWRRALRHIILLWILWWLLLWFWTMEYAFSHRLLLIRIGHEIWIKKMFMSNWIAFADYGLMPMNGITGILFMDYQAGPDLLRWVSRARSI